MKLNYIQRNGIIEYHYNCGNHTVAGVARNSDGEVVGFYVCDSGRGEESDAARFLTVDEFAEAYNESVYGATAIVTEDSIRGRLKKYFRRK